MRNFTTLLYIYRFFDDFIIIYPLYTIMFEKSGLDLSQISILLFVWSLTTFILEVPSGALADKFDRKLILTYAQIIRIVGYIIWLMFPNFLGFLIGFILWGIKSALTSGTLESYTFDGLRSHKNQNDFSKILGRMNSFSLIAIFSASIIASLVSQISYANILILSIVALSVSIVAAVLLPSFVKQQSTEELTFFQTLKEGIKFSLKNKKVLWLIIVMSLVVGFTAVDEYFGVYGLEAGLTENLIGIYLAIFTISQAIVSFFTYRLKTFSKVNLNLMLIVFSICLLIWGISINLIGLSVFLIIGMMSVYIEIIGEENLQILVDDQIRSTVSSVKGFGMELFAFSTFIIFALTSQTGLSKSIITLGIVSCIISITLIIFNKISK